MAGGSGGDSATLETTPTWAVAAVCLVLIATSILIEHAVHLLGKYLERKRRKSLLHVHNKIKSDLLLLGFISLLLTIFQGPVTKICIPKGVAESFIACSDPSIQEDEESECKDGKFSLMSPAGFQELQLLIFFVAFFHVLSNFLTFSLGVAKMKRWEHWEAETRTLEYQYTNDPRRFHFLHQTSFGRRHLKFWAEHRLLRLPVSFLRQFFGSVYKVDYLTLRHGFIMAHFSEGSTFDFQKYLKRALEKDFEAVVGMRLWLWVFSVLFIFFNAHNFYDYAWLPFIPLVTLLVVGTKLQGIITKMCLDSSQKSHVITGAPLVRPSDHFFWFDQPKFLLHLMHFVSFQNSFQLAFFTWSWRAYGMRSCFHQDVKSICIKMTMGLIIPILCGYVTLPLYSLVTQMGTSMQYSVFPERVVGGLKRWHANARKKAAQRHNRSTDALVNASVQSSLSFSTLDTRSVDMDCMSDNGMDEENAAGEMPNKRVGSFQGFEVSPFSSA